MKGIVLGGHVSSLLEFIDPVNHFPKDLADRDDSISATKLPLFVYRFFALVLDDSCEIFEKGSLIKLVRISRRLVLVLQTRESLLPQLLRLLVHGDVMGRRVLESVASRLDAEGQSLATDGLSSNEGKGWGVNQKSSELLLESSA